MKKFKFIIILLFAFFVTGCTQEIVEQKSINTKGGGNQNVNNNITDQKNNLSECEKANGVLIIKDECDASKSEWCTIVPNEEECYADLVKNGRCPKEYRYSEKLGGIPFSPRVLCDNYQ